MRTGAMLAVALALFLTGAAGWPVPHTGEESAQSGLDRTFLDRLGAFDQVFVATVLESDVKEDGMVPPRYWVVVRLRVEGVIRGRVQAGSEMMLTTGRIHRTEPMASSVADAYKRGEQHMCFVYDRVTFPGIVGNVGLWMYIAEGAEIEAGVRALRERGDVEALDQLADVRMHANIEPGVILSDNPFRVTAVVQNEGQDAVKWPDALSPRPDEPVGFIGGWPFRVQVLNVCEYGKMPQELAPGQRHVFRMTARLVKRDDMWYRQQPEADENEPSVRTLNLEPTIVNARRRVVLTSRRGLRVLWVNGTRPDADREVARQVTEEGLWPYLGPHRRDIPPEKLEAMRELLRSHPDAHLAAAIRCGLVFAGTDLSVEQRIIELRRLGQDMRFGWSLDCLVKAYELARASGRRQDADEIERAIRARGGVGIWMLEEAADRVPAADEPDAGAEDDPGVQPDALPTVEEQR